jgi:hypothetical protein
VYSGKLTFNAQHNFPNEKAGITFWDSLDIIGVSGYHESGRGEDFPAIADLEREWRNWNANELKPLAQQYGKPLVFTEIGFKSTTGAHRCPGCWWHNQGYNGNEQANDYQALFQAFRDEAHFGGLQIWDWNSDPNYGWPGNVDYSPQHKPAEDLIRTFWAVGGGGSSSSSSTTSSSSSSTTSSSSSVSSSSSSSVPANTAFDATASAPASVAAGSTVNGTSTATNKSALNVGGIAIDTEIYNPSGLRVFQAVTENQAFTAGQARNFAWSWVPTANGTYTVKVGIFANAWSTLLKWNDEAVKVTVGSAATSSSSSSSSSFSSVSSVSSSSSSSSSSLVSSSSSSSSSSTSVASNATITPASATVRAGGVIDFGGRNWGREEDVRVTINGGTPVTTVHADGGGNFSTGSIRVPTATGTKTYTFTGTRTGTVRTATVTMVP